MSIMGINTWKWIELIKLGQTCWIWIKIVEFGSNLLTWHENFFNFDHTFYNWIWHGMPASTFSFRIKTFEVVWNLSIFCNKKIYKRASTTNVVDQTSDDLWNYSKLDTSKLHNPCQDLMGHWLWIKFAKLEWNLSEMNQLLHILILIV